MIPAPSSTTDLHRLDAHAAAQLIRNGELSPIALTETMLERISRLDPDFRSYAHVTSTLAREQAARAESDIRRGLVRGPLHGVPIAVKDVCDTAGLPTAAGFSFLSDRRPSANATVIDRLAASGTVFVGKLRTTEGAFAIHNDGLPAPRNPWNPDYWAGHSSSGSGVATAAGLTFASIGTDTGGSIRYPASANGIVGLKPTWGRVSRHGIFPMAGSLDHVGVLARSVTDAALMLGVVAGYDENDATSSRRPVPRYQDGFANDARGLRIAVDRKDIEEGADSEVRTVLANVEEIFRSLGAEIVEATMPSIASAIESWLSICGAEGVIAHSELYSKHKNEYSSRLTAFLERGSRIDIVAFANASLTRLALTEHVDSVLLNADAILMPVQSWTPPSLAQMEQSSSDPNFVGGLLRFTAPSNLTGHPSLTLPGGMANNGVPVGFQLIGRKFDEAALLSAGHAYQEATRRNTPPIF